jgi:adenylate cyclase
MQEFPVILTNVPNDHNRNRPHQSGAAVIGAQYFDRIIQYPGLLSNTSALESHAVGVGTVNTLPEIDGVVRRMPLIAVVGDKLYPSLGMEVMRVSAGDSTFQVKLNELGVEKMRIPKFGPVTTDNLGRIWIDWSKQSQSYSATQLPQDLNGAIVIIGPTASGIANPVPTAQGAVFPHHVQATVISTMMDGTTIQRPDWADGAEIMALAVLSMLLIFLGRWTYVGIVGSVVVIGVCLWVPGALYSSHAWLTDSTLVVAGIVLVLLHAYGLRFVSEYLAKQQIKKQFGTYLSPALVEKLQKNPELLCLGGESRELSIMFTDVRGFTTISEHYGKDVQGLTQIMNRYMTAMTAKILENNGTLDKYIGDAQMAFWNAPLDEPDHAKMAVKTALEMMENLDGFNKESTKEGIPPFGMGLGINTGTVVVGNMGSDQRFDYTCLGDSVNLASRLEGQSKSYGVRIILGPDTAKAVKSEYNVVELDCIAVKGKTEGVRIYTVLPTVDAGAMAEYVMATQTHDEMLAAYRAQQWKKAQELCAVLRTEFDGEMEKYYDAWLERIDEMKQAKLPADWDGVFRATSK